MITGPCYWRFTSEGKDYHYGYATMVGEGLYRMGLWNGDTTRGPIVNLKDIEIK